MLATLAREYEIAGPEGADMPGRRLPAEQGGDRLQRRDQHLPVALAQPFEPRSHLRARARVETVETGAPRLCQTHRPAAPVLPPASLDPALCLEAAEDAAQIAGV